MASGGARVRSGPPPSAESGRSDSRNIDFVDLPAKTRKRKPPTWPLVTPPTPAEEAEWEQVWAMPQATAWRMKRYAYMLPQLALLVRVFVRSQDIDAPPAIIGQLIRLQDQLGFSEAGMARLNWRIIDETQVSKKPERGAARRRKPNSSRARLEVINGGAQT
jgi:hypothetical protein